MMLIIRSTWWPKEETKKGNKVGWWQKKKDIKNKCVSQEFARDEPPTSHIFIFEPENQANNTPDHVNH